MGVGSPEASSAGCLGDNGRQACPLEHSAVADPVAHYAKRRQRWLIVGAIAAVSALTVMSFGVWGLVYPAIVLLIARKPGRARTGTREPGHPQS